MRYAALLLAGLACLTPQAASAEPDSFRGNRNIQFETDFDFFPGGTNRIVASGAFEDEGTIQHDHSEIFRGATGKVLDSPQFGQGSFTWEINNVFARTGGHPGPHGFYQTWRIIGGTGKYEGMTGYGTSTGTWDDVAGTIHAIMIGTVDCPRC